MRSEPHDGAIIVDKSQINGKVVNYGYDFMGYNWIIRCFKLVLRRFSSGPTRGRAIRPALKRRKKS